MKKINLLLLMLSFSVVSLFATKVNWTGTNGDWSTASNWNSGVPTAADSVYIAGNVTVSNALFSDFKYMEVEAGSVVNSKGGGFHSYGNEMKIYGTLDKPGAQAVRYYDNTILDIYGTLGGGVAWVELKNCTANFHDGAIVHNTVDNFQLSNDMTLGFNLSATGFTPIGNGDDNFQVRPGGESNWSNITFNIDLTAYTGNAPEIILMDFSGHDGTYNGEFNPVININDGGRDLGYTLSFSTSTSQLVLTKPVEWDGEANDNVWGTAANWSGNEVPENVTTVIVGNNAQVTGATKVFNELTVEDGAKVSFDDFIDDGPIVNAAGAIAYTGSGAFRVRNGSVVNLSGELESITNGWFEINNATFNFMDGASFGNTINDFQLTSTVTLGFTLGAAGFTAIASGDDNFGLNGGGGNTWADITFNVDLSAYSGSATDVVLMDFSRHADKFSNTFDPTINIETGISNWVGTLSFDVTESQVVLTIANDTPTRIDTNKSSFSVYAFNKSIFVQGNVSSYQLIDLQGRIVRNGKANTNKLEIPVSRSGLYILSIKSSDNSVSSQKVLVK